MTAFNTEKVLSVHHRADVYLAFTRAYDKLSRLENDQLVMVGLMVDGKPLTCAYSVVSTNWEEHLGFFSIEVQDGSLTSRFQHLKVGDEVLVSKEPAGTLVVGDLSLGKHLYLLSISTGIVPFLSVTKDPEIYERLEKAILIHGVCHKKDLAYYDRFTEELPEYEYLDDLVKDKLIYYPVVSREEYERRDHLTDLMVSGRLFEDIGSPKTNPQDDHTMLCGGPTILRDTHRILNDLGLVESPRVGVRGNFLVGRVFVDQQRHRGSN